MNVKYIVDINISKSNINIKATLNQYLKKNIFYRELMKLK